MLHKRESHGFSPSVPHRLDHEVSLQVLEGALREGIRTIIRQVCKELGVQIVSGVLSREHVHIFVGCAAKKYAKLILLTLSLIG